jgi:hypothetical protein
MNDDIEKLRPELKNLADEVELVFYGKDDDPFSVQLEEFVNELSEASSGKIRMTTGTGEDHLPARPAFTLKGEGGRRFHYLAQPEANEVAPFLKALQLVASGEAHLDDAAEAAIGRVESPAEIWVFVSPFCTNCPIVVDTVLSLGANNSLLNICIIDVQRYTKLAEGFAIKSVPAIVIDVDLVLVGQVSPERLATLIEKRGENEYEVELVRSLMHRGRTSEAVDWVSSGKGQRALMTLFQEQELSTRMGVLVIMEGALEKNPQSVKNMVPALIELLSHEDARIRGDIADFLGGVGDSRAIPHLENLTKDADPDVAEAAEDALEELHDSMGDS